MRLINVTEHPLRFRDHSNRDWSLEPSGVVVRAVSRDQTVRTLDQPGGKTITLVQTFYEPNEADLIKLRGLKVLLHTEGEEYLLVGSTLAAMAYPWQVVASIPISGLEKVPPRQKVMRDDRFVIFT